MIEPLAALLALQSMQEPPPKPAPQNPSPMVEHTRAHARVEAADRPGIRLQVTDVLPQPVHVFIPPDRRRSGPMRLLVHFHGAAFVAEHAVSQSPERYVLAAVNLGAGSRVYDRAFSAPSLFDELLAAIRLGIQPHVRNAELSTIVLSGFSAGHGAIRAILREPRHEARVSAVLLLDGLHTGYLPDRKVLADGGALDERHLASFLRFARAAIAGEKRFVVTHSEIFPGTFASTTETTDHLIRGLGLRRTPVLEWGPLGMQLLSTVEQGRLLILGFAGNSAPDHVDHFHAMDHFLARLDGHRTDIPDRKGPP